MKKVLNTLSPPNTFPTKDDNQNYLQFHLIELNDNVMKSIPVCLHWHEFTDIPHQRTSHSIIIIEYVTEVYYIYIFYISANSVC